MQQSDLIAGVHAALLMQIHVYNTCSVFTLG